VPTTQFRGLPEALLWLQDAPLFVDAPQISSFNDAVTSPEYKQGKIGLEISQRTVDTLKAKGELEASVTTEKFAALLAPLFAFIKPSIKASGAVEGESESTKGKTLTVELEPISTPQRQLKQLALYYLVNNPDRIFFVDELSDSNWRQPRTIAQVPRPLVFLNLPDSAEAIERNLPQTKLIPTAAEFANGAVVPLYRDLRFTEDDPPEYPERAESIEELKARRKRYWQWFDQYYSATKAMIAVEEAASKQHERIRWIDYRLPVSAEGDTLHLHVCPAGTYDTGTFAYNLIKRGYKHGIRLIGTLKSEPDLNVLAIYER